MAEVTKVVSVCIGTAGWDSLWEAESFVGSFCLSWFTSVSCRVGAYWLTEGGCVPIFKTWKMIPGCWKGRSSLMQFPSELCSLVSQRYKRGHESLAIETTYVFVISRLGGRQMTAVQFCGPHSTMTSVKGQSLHVWGHGRKYMVAPIIKSMNINPAFTPEVRFNTQLNLQIWIWI